MSDKRKGILGESVVRGRFDRKRVFTRDNSDDESPKTQQQFKEECDMNRIVKNAERGIAPRFLARGVPQFGDFSNVPNLMEAHNIMQRAQEAFMNLPAALRLELGNDPTRINELTREQAERFKLTKPTPPPPADPAPPVQGGTAGTEPAKPTKSDKKGQDN